MLIAYDFLYYAFLKRVSFCGCGSLKAVTVQGCLCL